MLGIWYPLTILQPGPRVGRGGGHDGGGVGAGEPQAGHGGGAVALRVTVQGIL